MEESSHVSHINVFLSHSLRLLLYWNPNKTDSLQWTEEDKFGFLSSFALFDASLTKRGYKYRKASRLQFCEMSLMLIWLFPKRMIFPLNASLYLEGTPVLKSKSGPDILYVHAVR